MNRCIFLKFIIKKIRIDHCVFMQEIHNNMSLIGNHDFLDTLYYWKINSIIYPYSIGVNIIRNRCNSYSCDLLPGSWTRDNDSIFIILSLSTRSPECVKADSPKSRLSPSWTRVQNPESFGQWFRKRSDTHSDFLRTPIPKMFGHFRGSERNNFEKALGDRLTVASLLLINDNHFSRSTTLIFPGWSPLISPAGSWEDWVPGSHSGGPAGR